MTSRANKSPGHGKVPLVFFESSMLRVSTERSSSQLEDPHNKSKKNFAFHLPKSFSFRSRRDVRSAEIALEDTERVLDRRAWLRIEREKARKELHLDQEGDTTETTTTSELTTSYMTPKPKPPTRTSSYSPSMASSLPVPLMDSPRRRDGKTRRGRRSQLRETLTDEATTKEDGTSLFSPVRGAPEHCGDNQMEVTLVSPGSQCVTVGKPESSPRRPRSRSVGPGRHDGKDGTAGNCVSSETPARRPRRRSLGPSRRQLRPLGLTGVDTPALNPVCSPNSKGSSSESPLHLTSNYNLPEDHVPKSNAHRRNRNHPSSQTSRYSSRNLSELSEEDDCKVASPHASPRRRLQARKVMKKYIMVGGS